MTTDKYKCPFNPKLAQNAMNVPNRNNFNSYFPIRTKGNDFDWNAVIGLVLRGLLRKKIENYTYENFEEDCEEAFKKKALNDDHWHVLKEMYFGKKDILTISPELLLFLAQKGEFNIADERIASLFINLLSGQRSEGFEAKVNFIEHEILGVFRLKMKEHSPKAIKEAPYLPYISKVFRDDLKFLSSRPKYLLCEFEKFLSFYGFTYTAQLSLSLKDWRTGESPKPKPLYFIMDHERAGQERTHIKKDGYAFFNKAAFRLFPMLTMLELLQPEFGEKENKKIPLWMIASGIKESQLENLKEQLENFARAFRSERALSHLTLIDSDSALDWLGHIMMLAQEQFEIGERKNINKKFVDEVNKYLASHFIQNRGRSGRILVLNQDYIILLTNLVIGENEKIRFHELLLGFQLRGVFVDKQTQQELIKFYERIGNVERMSDSGDAVYVRKTI